MFILVGFQIYRSCEETCRLNENGNLNVPVEKTDTFCQGPCLSETNLVLNCLDNVFSNFIFYNRATIQDIRETIEAGCGYGPQRGISYVVLLHAMIHWRLKQLYFRFNMFVCSCNLIPTCKFVWMKLFWSAQFTLPTLVYLFILFFSTDWLIKIITTCIS